ncbi:MAG TPA: AAA family ATPase [Methylophilaceae bacterium]|nr:AAA family ATPase [Methylophilaceae bacterium]
MYYAHFGLKEPPFKITPNTEFFFTGGNRGAILDALMYAITSGEGIVKVVGEVGSGKTMICRMLQTQLPEHVESIYLANPSVAPEDVLHAIAFELQLQLPQNADRLQVMQVLQKYLLDRHAEGKQVVIFVEEAQGMPLATLEEIRLLSNLETKHDKLLQIVLFGQPELDVNLNANHIRQLRERITHSFNLGPLNEKAIGEYLIFRLRAAGYFGPHLFTAPAIAMIAKSAEGLVRRVNILADKALLAAFSQNVYQVTPKHVSAAIKDSEFGAEQVKRALKSRTLVAIVATLLIGLVTGYLVNSWLPKLSTSTNASSQKLPMAKTEPEILLKSVVVDKESASPAAASKESAEASKDHTLTAPVPVVPLAAPVPQPALQPAPVAQANPVNQAVVPKPAEMHPSTPTAPVATKLNGAPKMIVAPLTPVAQPLSAQAAAPQAVTTAAASNSSIPEAVVAKSQPEPVANSNVAEPLNSADILQSRLDEAQLWLKQQPASTVTIQLFGSANDDQLKRQLTTLVSQLELNAVYPFRTKVSGKPFVSVLYGSFASKQEALQAIAKLPSSLKAYQPHLRTVGGILKETNQFQ